MRRTRLARAVVALCIASGALNLVAVVAPYREFERLAFDPEQRALRALDDRELAATFGRLQREPALAPYVELVAAHGIRVSREDLRQKLELNTRVLRFAPVNVVAVRQAMLLAAAGDQALAARQLEYALRAYPAAREYALRELTALARSYPGEFAPLLELAASR